MLTMILFQSMETICLLLAYKIKYPENFFLLRGNRPSQRRRRRQTASIGWLVASHQVAAEMGFCCGFRYSATAMGECIFSDYSKLAQKLLFFFRDSCMYLEMSRPTFLGGGAAGMRWCLGTKYNTCIIWSEIPPKPEKCQLFHNL